MTALSIGDDLPLWSWVQFATQTSLKVVIHWLSQIIAEYNSARSKLTVGSTVTDIAGYHNHSSTQSILWTMFHSQQEYENEQQIKTPLHPRVNKEKLNKT